MRSECFIFTFYLRPVARKSNYYCFLPAYVPFCPTFPLSSRTIAKSCFHLVQALRRSIVSVVDYLWLRAYNHHSELVGESLMRTQ